MKGDTLLKIDKLEAGYGKIRVLHGVSLEVSEGGFVTIVGANGAGKSTLLKCLMGLVRAKGEMSLHGRSILGLPAHRRVGLGIGYIPEGRHVFPELSVEENILVTATRNRSARREELLERSYSLFPRLGERRSQAAGSLSGGEQQMLAFARALALDPSLIIADEISLGLAPIVVDKLFEVLADMRARGKTILLAEQNAKRALEAADRAYVLEAGRVMLEGEATALARDPKIVEAYLQNL
ncbi:MAG TPA: ABC transporter ATP-binding protein [Rectinemataceae bacterium]|nr:ABC transporter ATP-binding protein [Rectinemataceae bacterium]